MATLIERARQVIAAEDDDYFQANTIRYYLNKGQRKVVSYMVNKEREHNRSLRALDNLKKVDEVTLSSGTAKDDYYEVEETFPNNLNQFLNLVYNKKTILQELPSHKLYMLEWGNLVPTSYESYFYVTNDGTNKVFRLYLSEQPDGSTDKLEIFYVAQPTNITDESTTFDELPEQLENAVIYSAATMMASQELNEGTELYNQLYQEELQANVY